MTAETKTSIQLSDIQTVQFECKKCHTITEWPLSLGRPPLAKCPSCDEPQWMHHGGETFIALNHLLELMHRFSAADGEGFVMRFGVSSFSTP